MIYARWIENPAPAEPPDPAEPESPETGDKDRPDLWTLLLMFSGAALTGIAIYRKRPTD